MVIVWWFSAGLIHHSFIKPGETITAEKYCRDIDEMHQKLTCKQPALVNRKGLILIHDNTRPHVLMIISQKLHTLNYEVFDHPPYAPDLSPTDFHFFKHLDNFMQEKCFRNPKDAETAFNEFVLSRTIAFYDPGIKKNLFLVSKSVLKLMVPILINKIYSVKTYSFFK